MVPKSSRKFNVIGRIDSDSVKQAAIRRWEGGAVASR